MHGHQQHLISGNRADAGRVGIGGRGGFPGAGLLHREQALELTAEARAAQQPVGDVGGSVAEGGQAQPALAQQAHPVRDVGMNAEIGEA
jgi:hypothetical protein